MNQKRSFDPSRRQFAGLVGGAGLLALAGCGGGGGGGSNVVSAPGPVAQTPPPPGPPVPTAASGLSLLAGGLGGAGFLEAQGTQARLTHPDNMAAGKDGVVYFSDGLRIGKISAEGNVQFLADFPYMTVSGMACDSHGVLYACANGVGTIYKLVEDAAPRFELVAGKFQPYPMAGFVDGAGASAVLSLPRAPVFDASDNLYFIDAGNHAVRKLSAAGIVSTVAGQPSNTSMVDGQGAAAGFESPQGMVLLPDGNFLVLDNNRWRKMTPAGLVSTLPGTAPQVEPLSLVLNDANSLYAILGQGVVRVTLDGSVIPVAGVQDASGYAEGSGTQALFNKPADLIGSGGALLVSDGGNDVIRRVVPSSGQTSAWIGSAPQPGRVDAAGAQARFAAMGAMVVDTDGNAYVIDTERKTLRKVTPEGLVSTLFQDFPSDGGVAVDPQSNFYGVRDRTIVKVSSSGVQSVLAGQAGALGYADGPGTSARFARPMGLAIDAKGNLLVGDAPERESAGPFTDLYTLKYGNTIRSISPIGEVSTIAGVAGRTIQPTSAPDPTTDFNNPRVIAIDAAGDVLVMDGVNIRRLGAPGSAPVVVASASSSTSSFAGMAVTPSGAIYYCEVAVVSSQDGSSSVTIRKVGANGATSLVVGAPDRLGVRLSSLPAASLNMVTAMAAVSDHTLYCCSENAVLRVQLD